MQNSLVYTMISPVIVTIYRYIADKKKLFVTKHPTDAAPAAANHARFYKDLSTNQHFDKNFRATPALQVCSSGGPGAAAPGRAAHRKC
jgi:hypothetical protein